MGQPFPGPWTFTYHPWAREMHDCDEELIIGQKGAQLAYTETVLNRTFYEIDVHGRSVLYVLPASTPDASDFSTARFDPALENSPHLVKLFSDVKNIGHKRAGNANLFIRGSRSRSQLKSIPVGFLVCDEVDEMVQDNIKLALERMSGQKKKQAYFISTPTIPGFGINGLFESSTQDHYHFRCPHCGRYTELIYPDCLVITSDDPTHRDVYNSHLICKECKHILNHSTKPDWLADVGGGGTGKWIPTFPDRVSRGFHVSQLYSSTIKPSDIAIIALEAEVDPVAEQELYNSKLGLPKEVAGAKLTEAEFNACIGSHIKVDSLPGDTLVTMGVDVGKWIHYSITQWFIKDIDTLEINLAATGKLVMEGKVKEFEELDELVRRFSVTYTVIDANPERRLSVAFCKRWYGVAKACFYGRGVSGKQIHVHDDNECTITVDRTNWLDMTFSRFRDRSIKLPIDVSQEYRSHLQEPVKVYKKDADGNPISTYVTKPNAQDHLAHAQNYAEIALRLGAALIGAEDIRGIL